MFSVTPGNPLVANVDSKAAAVATPKVAICAVLKNEAPYVEEWVAYHRLIGVDHFFLYDSSESPEIAEVLKNHNQYVTVIPWSDDFDSPEFLNRTPTTKACNHFLKNYASSFNWVLPIDGNEFLVLRKDETLAKFLVGKSTKSTYSFTRRIFGNNGHFFTPAEGVLAGFTRRQFEFSSEIRTLNPCDGILAFTSIHFTILKATYSRSTSGLPAANNQVKDPKDNRARFPQREAFIHHYSARSLADSFDQKFDQKTVTGNSVSGIFEDFATRACLVENQVEDLTLARWVPAIRAYLRNLQPSLAESLVDEKTMNQGSYV